jgi:hypothetical protein
MLAFLEMFALEVVIFKMFTMEVRIARRFAAEVRAMMEIVFAEFFAVTLAAMAFLFAAVAHFGLADSILGAANCSLARTARVVECEGSDEEPDGASKNNDACNENFC